MNFIFKFAATSFIEFWKRRQAVIAWEWDLHNFEEEEQTRPEYETHGQAHHMFSRFLKLRKNFTKFSLFCFSTKDWSPKFATGLDVRFTTISSQIFANCMNIFHKTEVQTVILRCWMGLYLNWFKNYYTNAKKCKNTKNAKDGKKTLNSSN